MRIVRKGYQHLGLYNDLTTHNLIRVNDGDYFFAEELAEIARACSASFIYKESWRSVIPGDKRNPEGECRSYKIETEYFCIQFSGNKKQICTIEELKRFHDD